MNLSKRVIPIRFTPKQKELVMKFLGRTAIGVDIPSTMGPILKYGIRPDTKAMPKNMILLTSEQKALLNKEFNVTCDYIELTRDMKFR